MAILKGWTKETGWKLTQKPEVRGQEGQAQDTRTHLFLVCSRKAKQSDKQTRYPHTKTKQHQNPHIVQMLLLGFLFWKQDLTHYVALELIMKSRLVSNSQQSTCFWLPRVGNKGDNYHAHLPKTLFVFAFGDRVSLYSLAGLELTERHLPLPPKGWG